MTRIKKNPFRVPMKDQVHMRVHISLARVIRAEQKKVQKQADKTYGKRKMSVSESFASKIVGLMLK